MASRENYGAADGLEPGSGTLDGLIPGLAAGPVAEGGVGLLAGVAEAEAPELEPEGLVPASADGIVILPLSGPEFTGPVPPPELLPAAAGSFPANAIAPRIVRPTDTRQMGRFFISITTNCSSLPRRLHARPPV